MTRILATFSFVLLAASCATNSRPPCRQVSADEFMRPHLLKGLPSDRFIGVAPPPFLSRRNPDKGKAYKEIWEIGLNHSFAILWCPVTELPKDYLKTAKEHPNRENKH